MHNNKLSSFDSVTIQACSEGSATAEPQVVQAGDICFGSQISRGSGKKGRSTHRAIRPGGTPPDR